MPPAAEPAPIADIASYHAHIYYDPGESRDRAARLRAWVDERFAAQIGAWHDEPVGPHPKAMFQIAFAAGVFPILVPWLMLNRLGLTVFVHPNTDNPQDDHLVHALWLGEVLKLDGTMLPRSMSAAGRTHSPVVPNTKPHAAP